MTLALRDITKQWRLLATAASVGTSTAAAAIYPPPVGDAKGFIALGAFFATAVCGLVYVVMTRYSARRHTSIWTVVATVVILLSFGAIQLFASLSARYVGTYQGEKMMVGDEFTGNGAAWSEQSKHTSPDDLLFDAAGHAERIWTTASIQRAGLRIRELYFVCVSLLAVCVLTTVQAVFCGTRGSGRRDSTRPAPAH